ncbi:MAG: carbonic anhydrase family protein [Isosphaeraceae bacterium]
MNKCPSESNPPFGIIGTQQSPIIIDPDEAVRAAYRPHHLRFHYGHCVAGTYVKENFVIKSTGDEGGLLLKEGDRDWFLRKIHMHNHIEHLLAGPRGERDDLYEMHLLHSSFGDREATGDLLVIAVFFRISPEAPRKPSLYEFNAKTGEANRANTAANDPGVSGNLDPHEFLPEWPEHRADWFHYMGSLTSPPFREAVRWYVLHREIGVHPEDLDHLMVSASQDARGVLPLFRRFVIWNFQSSDDYSSGTSA